MAGMTAYWYLTRSTGAVALVLLTASVVIGIAAIGRFSTVRWPRFAVDGAHRSVSLLAVAFLAIHIVTAVLDSFAPISLINAVIPFTGTYRPLWLGLGALSFDLLLAIAITSAVRQRVGHGAWRAIHWLAYAAWPIAVLHGFGTGSDASQSWMLALEAICITAVLLAVFVRAIIGWPENLRLRLGAIGSAAAFALGLAVWLPSGPLGKHWARRSGTPASLLAPSSARGGHG
jgi:methionine sulfoxide reductase heme-binding subunit